MWRPNFGETESGRCGKEGMRRYFEQENETVKGFLSNHKFSNGELVNDEEKNKNDNNMAPL